MGNHIDPSREPPSPRILRALLGDDVFARVVAVTFIHGSPTDTDVDRLGELPELKDLHLRGGDITDRGVALAARIPKLRALCLSDTSVTPDGISRLSDSAGLVSLTLYGPSITDSHL